MFKNLSPRGASLMLAAPLWLLVVASTVSSQGLRQGPIVVENATNEHITVFCDRVESGSGARSLDGATWNVKPGMSYVGTGGGKLIGHRFVGGLVTDEGRTSWVWECNGLDNDGDFVMQVSPSLLRKHYEILSKLAILGANLEDRASGTEIVALPQRFAAGRAGLRVGDLVIGVDGVKVLSLARLREVLSSKSPGDVVRVTVLRGQDEVVVRVPLSAAAKARPEPVGPTEAAVQAASAQMIVAVGAWLVVASQTEPHPNDDIIKVFMKEAARAAAEEVLRTAMRSAVRDLAPSIAQRDCDIIAELFAKMAKGQRVHASRGAAAIQRFLIESGVAAVGAEFFSEAFVRLSDAVDRATAR